MADQEIIVACDMGGSLEAKAGADTGFQSQSLKAAHYLNKAGFKHVKHMSVRSLRYGLVCALCVCCCLGRHCRPTWSARWSGLHVAVLPFCIHAGDTCWHAQGGINEYKRSVGPVVEPPAPEVPALQRP
jgi:rhodanese-related sulfurtransferase